MKQLSTRMKIDCMKQIFILSLLVSSFFIAQSQNVGIGTPSPAGKLHIKGSADTSQLIIDANASQSNTHPLIRLRSSAGEDLLMIHSDFPENIFIGLNAGRNNSVAGGAYSNTFIGSDAGYSNTTGSGNTVNGSEAFVHNTTGSYNNANGYDALLWNSTGSFNVANGHSAMVLNTTGSSNTVSGYFSMFYNISGNYNTACGTAALRENTTGHDNTASGIASILHNVTGNYNTGIGSNALSFTSASDYNTAVGYSAGFNYDNGYNNVFLGANTDVNGDGYYNVIAIGQGTICTGSSQVTIGNGATGSYRAYANWSNISDGRFKKNIQDNVPGLDFITKLRPVTYNLDATGLDVFLHKNDKTGAPVIEKTKTPNDGAARAVYNKALKEKETAVVTGFVAQEVEATAQKMGFNFSGIDPPKNENDVYGLRYADFVVPLVKAVQEQQQMLRDMQKRIQLLEEQNKLLQQLISKN